MMEIERVIRGGTVVTEHAETPMDIAVAGGRIAALGDLRESFLSAPSLDARGLVVLPGLVDPHVHFREPGPQAEEDFLTGTRAAAAGGITTVLEQPVDTPPTTTLARFQEKVAWLQGRSYIDYGLWAGVVPDNLDEIAPMHAAGACAFKSFVCSSDPFYPMIDDGALLAAMHRIQPLGALIAIHAENQAIIAYAAARLAAATSVTPLDHTRSRPAIAELEAIQRMILLAGETGVRLHILHLSAADGAALVTAARQRGLPVTVETCPHYLVLDENALEDYGPYAKCNPPLRDAANQEQLWQRLLDGQIQCLVSDHSPYTSTDKAKGLQDIRLAPPGINGLELGLALMIDRGVHAGRITLRQLAQWMATEPARLFGLYPRKGSIQIGADADLTLVDMAREWTVQVDHLQTKNKWSPYDDWTLRGQVVQTLVRGRTVYDQGAFPLGPEYGQFLRPPLNTAPWETPR
jgi:allantoinase